MKRKMQATVRKAVHTNEFYIVFFASDLKKSIANSILQRTFKTRKQAVTFLSSLGFI